MNDRQRVVGDQLPRQNPAYGPLVPRQLRLARLCLWSASENARARSLHWAANTKGTLTVVVPLDGGKDQFRTREATQLERPG